VIRVGDIEKAIACLKVLDFHFDNTLFEHRLIIQKVIFLLQLKGFHLGYPYGLYVRGPYSPSLASDYYHQKEEFKSLITGKDLTGEEHQIIQNLDQIFCKKASYLEIGGTYGYFAYVLSYDPLKAMKMVKKMKSQYSDSQIAIGISKAKEFLYTPTEEEKQLLENETAPWKAVALNTLRGD